MLSSFSDFDCVSPLKIITVPTTKTYTTVVATPINEQVEKIKKVYDEKMANLDKQLSQEVKQHQLEEKQMKYIITQLVNQKQELEEKLTKTTLTTKSLAPSKPTTTKPPASFSSNLKKPIYANLKSNVKYISITNLKEVLTLKSPSFIKYNQI
jgi:predicted transcriptional regulator YdeE